MDPVQRAKAAVTHLVLQKRALEIAEQQYRLALREFNIARSEDEGGVRIPLPMLVQGDTLLDVRWEVSAQVVYLTKVANINQIGEES